MAGEQERAAGDGGIHHGLELDGSGLVDDRAHVRGYILYPGKLTEIETFRVGCIGHFGDAGIPGAAKAIGEALAAMGVGTGQTVAAEGIRGVICAD
ncbi:aspartate aminotransferase-like enzyme [Cupriavidus necator]|nr:aspartate aminotransferase-like enzyme [Cupriavidus necator]